jgi:hypothetical protein
LRYVPTLLTYISAAPTAWGDIGNSVLQGWTVFCRNWTRRCLKRRRQRTEDDKLPRRKQFETWLGFGIFFADWSFVPASVALLVGVLYGQVLPVLVTALIYMGLMAMYFPKRKEIENRTP